MNLARVWQVALRDYVETTRSKSFVVMLLIVPLILVGSIAIPRLLERTAEPSRFALLNLPPEWVTQLTEMYGADNELARDLQLETRASRDGAAAAASRAVDFPAASETEADLLRTAQNEVRSTKLYGYVTLETVEGGERRPMITARRTEGNAALRWLQRTLPLLVRHERASRLGLTPTQVQELNAYVPITTQVLSTESGEVKVASDTDKLASFKPVIFTYLLWIVVLTLTQRLLMSTIEEKTNRTIEVILSSMSPMEFMAGKVLSGVLEGITVLGVWMLCFYFAADYFTQRYMKGLDLTILFARKDHLVMFGLYFAMGYVLFASLIVGMGSLCNTIRDTQGLMTPVMLMMMVPMLVMMYVQGHPNSPVAIGLSWFPFFMPFLMTTRVVAEPPPSLLEIAGSYVVLLLAIYATTWIGAKLFRVGILMYGKPPKIGEIIRILRTPEGRAAARVA